MMTLLDHISLWSGTDLQDDQREPKGEDDEDLLNGVQEQVQNRESTSVQHRYALTLDS